MIRIQLYIFVRFLRIPIRIPIIQNPDTNNPESKGKNLDPLFELQSFAKLKMIKKIEKVY